MDILTREKLSSILTTGMDLIYLSVRLFSRRGGDELMEVEYHFIRFRVNENLLQHPSNNISIPSTAFLQEFRIRVITN